MITQNHEKTGDFGMDPNCSCIELFRHRTQNILAEWTEIQKKRESCVSMEVAQVKILERYGPEKPHQLNFSHPLQDLLKTSDKEYFASGLAGMESAASAIVISAKYHNELVERQNSLEEERRKLRNLGIPLCLLGVGFFLLAKARRIADQAVAITPDIENAKHNSATNTARLEEHRSAARSTYDQFRNISQDYFIQALKSTSKTWRDQLTDAPPMLRGNWDTKAWEQYPFPDCGPPTCLHGGTVELNDSGASISIPCFIEFVGSRAALRLAGPAQLSTSLLHSLILQLATLLPHSSTFTLLDPAGAGRAFPMKRDLPNTRTISGDLARDLALVNEEIVRIIETHIGNGINSFEDLRDSIRAHERFEFVVAANFPDGYDRRTIQALQQVARNGHVAGKYLILQFTETKEIPGDLSWNDFGTMIDFRPQNPPESWSVHGGQLSLVRSPDGPSMSNILRALANAKPPERRIASADLISLSPENWWPSAINADSYVDTPVGSISEDCNLVVWFGKNREGAICSHGAVAGMTGSGKSNFYHALICGLCTRYSPLDLELHLVDLKVGTEFQYYRDLPHARVIALDCEPELSRSVLRDFHTELERRNALFKAHGVSDLTDYRKVGSPGGRIPRSLLLIDEYQRLFEGDRDGEASFHLKNLAEQGRSAGLHLLLGSQGFVAVGMLNQSAIFQNLHLRVAMKMPLESVQSLSEFGRAGRRLIEQCDEAGKAVINADGGAEDANQFGRIVFIDKETELPGIVSGLAQKATQVIPVEDRINTVVFDGKKQPNLWENPQLRGILDLPTRPNADEWHNLAVKPVHQGGLGINDWFEGERPLPLWLGRELDVHRQSVVVLRRRNSENLLWVGDEMMAVTGMIAATLAATRIFARPEETEILILDRSTSRNPWERMLPLACDRLLNRIGGRMEFSTDAASLTGWTDKLLAEVDLRHTLSESEQTHCPTILLVISGADRITTLARQPGTLGFMEESPLSQNLKVLLARGPLVGIHTLIAFAGISPLLQVFERNQLSLFRHRVTGRLSDKDSFQLLDNNAAASLRSGKPVFAILQDSLGGVSTRFCPYSADAEIPWEEQFDSIASRLESWRANS
jgi:S-DNA-T family DNA segregation ATPase FtsK/SpoIIIE